MRIYVESLGLPTLSAVIGKKAEMDFDGVSVADLIATITQRFGPKARQALLDSNGELDLTIQVMVNDQGFIQREKLADHVLEAGDRVKLMLLVGGG